MVKSGRSYFVRKRPVKRAISYGMPRNAGFSLKVVLPGAAFLGRAALLCQALLFCVGGGLAGCSGQQGKKSPSEPVRAGTLFITSDLQGTIEPCGCTTNPLGDLARTTQLVEEARKSGQSVVHIDGGSTLFSATTVSDDRKPQELLKAALIRDVFTKRLKTAAIGLGPFDLALGAAEVKLPRQAANLSAKSGIPVSAPTVVTEGGMRIGVFGLVSKADTRWKKLEIAAPVAAAKKAIKTLEAQNPDVIVALLHMTKAEAAAVARKVEGIDFAVVGQTIPETELKIHHEANQIGSTWLIEPADRGQVLTRLDLHLGKEAASGNSTDDKKRARLPFSDAIGKSRADVAIAELDKDFKDMKGQIETWESDPSADPAFVKAKQSELAEIEKKRDRLSSQPLQVPANGPWFTLTQISISKSLACDSQVVAGKKAFDKAAGEANVKAATTKPLPALKGKAGYVGVEECSMCHDEAVDFWKKTKHFHAWETLEADNKQFNLECIGCHVTGWQERGGSNLAYNEPLRDVQCEVCHGPGSLHVEADGADDPVTVVRMPTQDLCVTCHSPEHSDTFQFEAYLRDVTGKGHGEEFRKTLGPGPTGLELRSAGLKAAGASIGANCPK